MTDTIQQRGATLSETSSIKALRFLCALSLLNPGVRSGVSQPPRRENAHLAGDP